LLWQEEIFRMKHIMIKIAIWGGLKNMKACACLILLLGAIIPGGCQLKFKDNNSVSLQTEDRPGRLHFTADYPEKNTMRVQNYVKKYLKEARIFSSADDGQRVEVRLTDGMQFYVKYRPGYLRMDMERNKNSESSYQRMKNMIKGIEDILKD